MMYMYVYMQKLTFPYLDIVLSRVDSSMLGSTPSTHNILLGVPLPNPTCTLEGGGGRFEHHNHHQIVHSVQGPLHTNCICTVYSVQCIYMYMYVVFRHSWFALPCLNDQVYMYSHGSVLNSLHTWMEVKVSP